jgi:GTP cyclohydrolase I
LLKQSLPRQERSGADLDQILEIRKRVLSPEHMQRFEGYLSEILQAFGMDLHIPSTKETPKRFLQALFDVTEGYDGDPKLVKMFEAEYRDEPDASPSQIIEGPIPFSALCEHHVFPFVGQAYVGYIADESILGISKLTRLVRLFARRFTVQERLGEQIASALEELLAPRGVAVYLEAHHLCVAMRGVHEVSPLTHTTTWRGEYARDAALRTEFLLMCGAGSQKIRER